MDLKFFILLLYKMGNHLCCCLIKNREYIIETDDYINDNIKENIDLINNTDLNRNKIYEQSYIDKFKKFIFKK